MTHQLTSTILLTTEHIASANGIPVLLKLDDLLNCPFAPSDTIYHEGVPWVADHFVAYCAQQQPSNKRLQNDAARFCSQAREEDTIREFVSGFLNPTNKPLAGLIRDGELDLATKYKIAPIDLAQIPSQDRHLYDSHAVVLPEKIAQYLESCTFPLSQDEREMLEIAIEKHYNLAPFDDDDSSVTECEWIEMDAHFQETGRTYQYVPECAPYKTGFTFCHYSKRRR